MQEKKPKFCRSSPKFSPEIVSTRLSPFCALRQASFSRRAAGNVPITL
jgi:hypothetical protein